MKKTTRSAYGLIFRICPFPAEIRGKWKNQTDCFHTHHVDIFLTPMKTTIVTLTLLIISCFTGFTQQPVADTIPEILKPQFAILSKSYPKFEKKHPTAPADSLWVFRSPWGSTNSVEVAFQGAEVVYMIFRKGMNGSRWNRKEIFDLHFFLYKDLLKEDFDPRTGFSRYNSSVATQNDAAVISRKDIDAKPLLLRF